MGERVIRTIQIQAPSRRRAVMEIAWEEKPEPRRRVRRWIAAGLIRVAGWLCALRVRVVDE